MVTKSSESILLGDTSAGTQARSTGMQRPHPQLSDPTDRQTKSRPRRKEIGRRFCWEESRRRQVPSSPLDAIEEVQVSRGESEAVRVPANPRAGFSEGCAISLSSMIAFGPIFRFTHLFHDSILSDNLK